MGNNGYADESERETADHLIAATGESRTAGELSNKVGPDDKTVSD